MIDLYRYFKFMASNFTKINTFQQNHATNYQMIKIKYYLLLQFVKFLKNFPKFSIIFIAQFPKSKNIFFQYLSNIYIIIKNKKLTNMDRYGTRPIKNGTNSYEPQYTGSSQQQNNYQKQKNQKILDGISDVVFTGTEYCDVDDIDDQQQFGQRIDRQYERLNGLENIHQEINGHEKIFQIQNCKLSPIIDTYIPSAQIGGQSFRVARQRINKDIIYKKVERNINWKQFLNPDVDLYYRQLLFNRKQAQMQPKQFLTPKNRHNQYSCQMQNYLEFQRSQQYMYSRQSNGTHPSRPSHRSQNNLQSKQLIPNHLQPEQIKSIKNKSTIQNQADQVQINNKMQQIKKKYEDKISVLEHQNTNLKDQLFYLRAAILAQYEAKQANNITSISASRLKNQKGKQHKKS